MDYSTMLMVKSDALPDVFLKVVEVKKLLASGNISTSEAVKSVGISRSAFYKYKDSVFSSEETTRTDISNLMIMLKDESGALSKVLSVVSNYGANILTINQSVPKQGVASVTISFTHNPSYSKKEFLGNISGLEQVVSATIQ